MKKKNTRDIEKLIIKYISVAYSSERKPRITTPELVAYANTKGANWRVSKGSCEKRTSCEGMVYSTGGGTRDYHGYNVYNMDRNGAHIFCSYETYRTIYDLIQKLPNYNELKSK